MATKAELPKGFFFRESDHSYFLEGKRMTGVTTILGVINKPALVGWAARMAVEYAVTNAEKIAENGDFLISPKTLEEAKNAHTKKKDAGATAGTDTHALIEAYVRLMIADQDGHALQMNDTTPITPFITWAHDNKVRFLASEKRVYSKELFLAGTYDMKLEMDGKTYIADVKTQKAIYDRIPFAQMAAYQYMEGEMGEPKVDGRLIIHFPRERAFNSDSDIYLSEHYEDDLKLFMAALEIYRNMNNRFEPLSTYKVK